MVRFADHIPRNQLADICRRHHIRRLSFFGSILRDDFGPESDIDVLIEFDRSRPVGFRIFRVEEELSRLFDGRKVDIVNPRYVNPRLKAQILGSAQVQYEEG